MTTTGAQGGWHQPWVDASFDTPEIRAAEDAYQGELEAERAAAVERTARQAEVYERAALGAYRGGHPPPPFPAEAPPLPPSARRDWTPAQLAAEARHIATQKVDRGIAAEVIVDIGRGSHLSGADIDAALEFLR